MLMPWTLLMGWHHDSLHNAKWELWQQNQPLDPIPNIQPWASVIQQTLSHQDVPEHFQKDDAMKHTIAFLEEEGIRP